MYTITLMKNEGINLKECREGGREYGNVWREEWEGSANAVIKIHSQR